MPINQNEAKQIASRIAPIFDQVIGEYNFKQYPAQEYRRFKELFSSLNCQDNDIADALIWKWGHWGKPNYPLRHRALIMEVQRLWPKFLANADLSSPKKTFDWWTTSLVRKTRYITVAYITHLIHHNAPLPIIDQHNFRAMNELINCSRPGRKAKKKPSTWSDIQDLKSFMTLVCDSMPGLEFGDLDRFLMMYGRNYAVR